MNNHIEKNNNLLLVANYKSDVGYAWWLMENFWSEIALHFLQSNATCTLIYPDINTLPNIIIKSPLNIIEHDFSDRSFSGILRLIKVIKHSRIGFIYLTDRPYYDWLYFVLRIVGVRRIVNHDHMPGERTKLPFYKKITKNLIHFTQVFSCDHYICVSKFVANRAVETACVPRNKCSYIHNGINLFDNTKSSYVNDILDIPRGSKIVVTTGRASFYKGIDILIRCAYILINGMGFENLYFLHIGSGPDLEKFKELAIELGVDEKFIFAGFRNDISKILPSCDIGIQVSQGEAFSLSILEYMWAGLATLAPNNCGNPEAIENEVNGILFLPGDINDIVNKISYILNHTEFTVKIKKAAQISVIEKFNIERCNRELISLLDKQFA